MNVIININIFWNRESRKHHTTLSFAITLILATADFAAMATTLFIIVLWHVTHVADA